MKQVIVNNYKIFKNEADTCQAVFKYWWSFEPYDSSDRTFKLSLNVTPVKGEGLDSSLDEDHFLRFPELITVLAKLQKKYDGEISAKDYRDVTYSFIHRVFSGSNLMCEEIGIDLSPVMNS